MSKMLEEKKIGRAFLREQGVRFDLKSKANEIVKTTENNAEAKAEVLYSFPGVFSFSLKAGDYILRLIKEGDHFRLMENSEKSELLLTIEFLNVAERGGSDIGKKAFPAMLAEGKMAYRGSAKHFNAILRIALLSDHERLTKRKQRKMYGMES